MENDVFCVWSNRSCAPSFSCFSYSLFHGRNFVASFVDFSVRSTLFGNVGLTYSLHCILFYVIDTAATVTAFISCAADGKVLLIQGYYYLLINLTRRCTFSWNLKVSQKVVEFYHFTIAHENSLFKKRG